jgi:YesN/AraC family two-component response regulator
MALSLEMTVRFFSNKSLGILMFDLVGTIVKTINDFGSLRQEWVLNDIRPIERVMQYRSIKEMHMEMILVLQETCALIVKHKANDSYQLGDEVKAYIEDHYKDMNLNVTMIGSHFGITPWYVSKLFKNQMGVTILDEINTYRIEHSKRILSEQTLSISEVAQELALVMSSYSKRIIHSNAFYVMISVTRRNEWRVRYGTTSTTIFSYISSIGACDRSCA